MSHNTIKVDTAGDLHNRKNSKRTRLNDTKRIFSTFLLGTFNSQQNVQTKRFYDVAIKYLRKPFNKIPNFHVLMAEFLILSGLLKYIPL